MSGSNTRQGQTVIAGLLVAREEINLGRRAVNFTLDWSQGNCQATILAASGLTITAVPVGVGDFQLRVTQDGTGNRLLPTFAPAINWLGGAPTLRTAAGAVDILLFYCDGARFFGRKV
jgi:hypothetical protein